MLVSQILQEKGDIVFTVDPDRTVGDAVTLLNQRRVGAVVVMAAGAEVAGILSERDLVRAVADHGAQALSKPLSAYMSSDVVYADPGETVEALLNRMTDRRIRHLPVCKAGRLIGIVSIGDLVKAKIAETVAEADGLKAYIAAG